MRTEIVPVGSRLVDSYPFSEVGTKKQARALKESGIDGLVGYLGVIDRVRVGFLLDEGLGFMPTTTAPAGAKYDGEASVTQIGRLGLTPDVSTWLDVEGPAAYRLGTEDPIAFAARIDRWCSIVAKARQMPCGYFGSPQPFTSSELYARQVVRYWKGIGVTRDRFGALAEPACAWCIWQAWHGKPKEKGMFWRKTAVFVDPNLVGADNRGRLPQWVIA